MFTPDALILFRAELSQDQGDYQEFFLQYIETDGLGIKMAGGLPRLWQSKNGAVFGPMIDYGSERFIIAKLDRKHRICWLHPYRAGER